MRFTGIAAAPGIALGPIVRLEREEFSVRDGPIAEADVERALARFHAALEQSRHDLVRIRNGIAAELGESDARIYDVQIMILEDPELRRAVEEGVRREHRYPGFVFRRWMAGVAAHLEGVDDEYLSERRMDVLDVERRVLRHLVGDGTRGLARLDQPAVIVAHELGPSEVALLERSRVLAFVTEVGGRTSHSAIVARGRGIPAVMSVRGVLQHVKSGEMGAVDGYSGVFELAPDESATIHYTARRGRFELEARELDSILAEPASTLDGRTIDLGGNIELPSDVDAVLAAGADSIGLFRTEFFYLNRLELPSEDEQYEAYKTVAERLTPRPVLFRTMDLGGDKVASYLGMTHESNPFLGWRGIRFALQHPDLFRTQLRAIYRASAHGRVRMMFPMVSSEDELLAALAMCAEARRDLAASGIEHDADLEIGVMVETPSAVWLADVLSRHARFLSIGSNDLTQYTLAMDRDNERLAHLYEPLSPAVLRSIRHTVRAAHEAGRWVGVCGEMAGDPRIAVLLIGLDVDELSMAPFDVPRVKAAVRSVEYAAMQRIADEAVAMSCARSVRTLLSEQVDTRLPDFLLVDR